MFGLGLLLVPLINKAFNKKLKLSDKDQDKFRNNYVRSGMTLGLALGSFIGAFVGYFCPVLGAALGMVFVGATLSVIGGIVTGVLGHRINRYTEKEWGINRNTENSWDYATRTTSFVGAAIGSLIGFFLPVPGGFFIGSTVGAALGGLIGWFVALPIIKKARQLRSRELKSSSLSWTQRIATGVNAGTAIGGLIGLTIGWCGGPYGLVGCAILGAAIGGVIGGIIAAGIGKRDNCDVFLMSNPRKSITDDFKKSDRNHLYLYKENDGKIFYYFKDDPKKYYLDAEKKEVQLLLRLNFDSSKEKPIKYGNTKITKAILNIISKQGHGPEYTQEGMATIKRMLPSYKDRRDFPSRFPPSEQPEFQEKVNKENLIEFEQYKPIIPPPVVSTAKIYTEIVTNNKIRASISLPSPAKRCDLFLMSHPTDGTYKKSNTDHLYLYQAKGTEGIEDGKIFYLLENEKHALIDNKGRPFKFPPKTEFNSSEENLVKYNDEKTIKAILHITSTRGHTAPEEPSPPAREHGLECDLVLMASPQAGHRHKQSNHSRLYLYKDEKDESFYYFYKKHKEEIHYGDARRLLRTAQFDQPEKDFTICSNSKIYNAVFNITSKRGHTRPLPSRSKSISEGCGDNAQSFYYRTRPRADKEIVQRPLGLFFQKKRSSDKGRNGDVQARVQNGRDSI